MSQIKFDQIKSSLGIVIKLLEELLLQEIYFLFLLLHEFLPLYIEYGLESIRTPFVLAHSAECFLCLYQAYHPNLQLSWGIIPRLVKSLLQLLDSPNYVVTFGNVFNQVSFLRLLYVLLAHYLEFYNLLLSKRLYSMHYIAHPNFLT